MDKKFIGIIPAVYEAPGHKDLCMAKFGRKSVLEQIYEHALQALDEVYVASCDPETCNIVKDFGGTPIKVSHKTRTQACFEAYNLIGSKADVIVNIPVNQLFINALEIRLLMHMFDEATTEIASLVQPFNPTQGLKMLEDPALIKVVMTRRMKALYFSRTVIPHVIGVDRSQWLDMVDFFTHVGIYAYRADILAKLVNLWRSPLELAESIEPLRWLQEDYCINLEITRHKTYTVNTVDDLARLKQLYPLD